LIYNKPGIKNVHLNSFSFTSDNVNDHRLQICLRIIRHSKTTPIAQKCLNAESYAKKKGLFFPMPIANVRV